MASARTGSALIAFPDHMKVTAEAANWIVRLDRGALSADELDALREWVSRSRRHRECLVKMAGDWDSMAILEGLADIFPLADFQSERHQEKKYRGDGLPGGPSRPGIGSRARLAWFGAAALASAVVAAALFAPNAPQPAEYETAAGEQARHILEDGSVIALNTGSRASVDYDGARRSVTLFAGEAGFEVAEDPGRPFVVYAGSGSAEAVGTVFNVRITGALVDVTVTEGVVRVLADSHAPRTVRVPGDTPVLIPGGETSDNKEPAAGKQVLLTAGQSARYDEVIRTLEAQIPDEILERKLAWRDGALIFSGETLEEALAEIGRYTDKELIITDASIAKMRIGGHYKTDDIDALLSALSAGFGLKVETLEGDRIQLSAL